ncbi:MAG: major capsid protein [Saprospiraceae bacterium]|nr:major capsid protein [Saprospiraceae bacterium]
MNKIVLAVVSLAAVSSANAALDPAVTSAISTAGTDGAMLGGLILAVLIGIAAFKWLRGAR